MFTLFDMYDAMCLAVDYINGGMDTNFPDPQMDQESYDAFEDRWIRRVMIPYIVGEMLDNDEEVSTVWKFKAQDGLFAMLRDCQVKEEYLVQDSGYFDVEYPEGGFPRW